MYLAPIAEVGINNEASFENTRTFSSGLNWYAVIGCVELTRKALLVTAVLVPSFKPFADDPSTSRRGSLNTSSAPGGTVT